MEKQTDKIKEKILPHMYCYFGSGMLSDHYDKNVANQMADECIEVFKEYAKDQSLSFKKWRDQNKWFFKTDFNNVVEYYNDHDGYVKTESELYNLFLTEQR